MFEVSRSYTFQAAHDLPHAPSGHKCRNLHGHSYVVELHVQGPSREPEGWVRDFSELDHAYAKIHEVLDHSYLNNVVGLSNPTSENLARWIWDRVQHKLPELSRVVVSETRRSRCVYEGGANGA